MSVVAEVLTLRFGAWQRSRLGQAVKTIEMLHSPRLLAGRRYVSSWLVVSCLSIAQRQLDVRRYPVKESFLWRCNWYHIHLDGSQGQDFGRTRYR